MELTYELYCLADATFYDDPNLAPRKSNPDFPFAQEPVPAGWERVEFDHWVSYTPDGAALPSQGWKVHVATCLDKGAIATTKAPQYHVPAAGETVDFYVFTTSNQDCVNIINSPLARRLLRQSGR